MYQAKKVVKSAEELQAILGPEFPSQTAKVIDHIDVHCRAWIERSTFVTIASGDSRGQMDVSPKGDPAGFVKVLDRNTLAVPDRIGNHRGDTFMNVLENPRVGLMFIIPMRKEVVRVNGSARVVMDEELLSLTEVNGHRPDLVLLVRVEEAFFHCGKSMIRSRMWQPDRWGSIDGLPSYAQALKDHGELDDAVDDLEKRMANNETDRLY
ncbi:MAG: pyridoxamine 5'-phosphate oxidase family protein [Paracoccaceae bacterium]|nr:pyridoxamine 5'-phosphate oxidase family protein [Paracoccaceae bacterium]